MLQNYDVKLAVATITQSPILGTTVTLIRLQQKGYESMLDYYAQVALQFNEPLYLFLRLNAWGIWLKGSSEVGVRAVV